jgi:hypothetical protein
MKSDEFLMGVPVETSNMPSGMQYFDADDELVPMAKKISSQTPHNMEIKVERIKFLYTQKVKKEGGVYVIGQLSLRSEVERAVHDDYDYVITLYHPVWKNLDIKSKFMQLDKILCGIKIDVNKKTGEEMVKKTAYDCREYMANLNYWGADKVLKNTEIVHLAIQQYLETKGEDGEIERQINELENEY